MRTNLDVLNTQQNVFQTRRDLAQAYFNYLVGVLRLKSAVGALDEQDLGSGQSAVERLALASATAEPRLEPRPQPIDRAAVRGDERLRALTHPLALAAIAEQPRRDARTFRRHRGSAAQRRRQRPLRSPPRS